MSATDELRKLLDERGVEWRSGLEGVTFVGDWCFVEYDDGRLAATCEPVLTPEHAIVATLGCGTLTAKQVRETVDKHWHDLSADYDMPEATALPEYSYDWQAIADELNKSLGIDRESELKDALNDVAEKWAIAQAQAEDSARRCRLLEALARDWQELYENPDYGECVRLIDRMRKLGIEVEQ